jgi:hypothetical protein
MMEQSSGDAAPTEAVASGHDSEHLQEAMVQSLTVCALVRKKPAGAGEDKALSTQLQKKPASTKRTVAQALATGHDSEQLQEAIVQSQPARAVVRKKLVGAGEDKALSTQLQKKPASTKKTVAQALATGHDSEQLQEATLQSQPERGAVRKRPAGVPTQVQRKPACTKKTLAKGVRARAAVFAGQRSKGMSQRAQVNFATSIGKWFSAVKEARQELGVPGFCRVGGKTEQGKDLYAKAKELYRLGERERLWTSCLRTL